MSLKSYTLALYRSWRSTATAEQIALADAIYSECEKHYEDGGDVIVETFTPDELLREFASVAEARDFCGLKVEQALSSRWGGDTDPELELERSRRFDTWQETEGGEA